MTRISANTRVAISRVHGEYISVQLVWWFAPRTERFVRERTTTIRQSSRGQRRTACCQRASGAEPRTLAACSTDHSRSFALFAGNLFSISVSYPILVGQRPPWRKVLGYGNPKRERGICRDVFPRLRFGLLPDPKVDAVQLAIESSLDFAPSTSMHLNWSVRWLSKAVRSRSASEGQPTKSIESRYLAAETDVAPCVFVGTGTDY